MIQLQEYLRELEIWQIKYDVREWHVILTGGDDKARWHYERMLFDDRELRAQLILYAANTNLNLRELIEERASIRKADGLPGDLLSAVKCSLGGKEE